MFSINIVPMSICIALKCEESKRNGIPLNSDVCLTKLKNMPCNMGPLKTACLACIKRVHACRVHVPFFRQQCARTRLIAHFRIVTQQNMHHKQNEHTHTYKYIQNQNRQQYYGKINIRLR